MSSASLSDSVKLLIMYTNWMMGVGCNLISGRPVVFATMYWPDRCYWHVFGRTSGEFCPRVSVDLVLQAKSWTP